MKNMKQYRITKSGTWIHGDISYFHAYDIYFEIVEPYHFIEVSMSCSNTPCLTRCAGFHMHMRTQTRNHARMLVRTHWHIKVAARCFDVPLRAHAYGRSRALAHTHADIYTECTRTHTRIAINYRSRHAQTHGHKHQHRVTGRRRLQAPRAHRQT